MTGYSVLAPGQFPDVLPGAGLPELIADSLKDCAPEEGDIVVIAHKIVSKAEGAVVKLDSVTPGEKAAYIAAVCDKDPRLVQIIINESSTILSYEQGPIICRHKRGYICANAAVDLSNSIPGYAVLLPEDPDASAARIRKALEEKFRVRLGVIICDTHGRAFRLHACGVSVGASGVVPQKSYIEKMDRAGRVMKSSVECVLDELASAATIVMGQGDEGRPVAIIRGCGDLLGVGLASDIIRPAEKDLFLKALENNSQEKAGQSESKPLPSRKSPVKGMVMIALTGAVAYILARYTKFPIFPSAAFLKLDFGETPLILMSLFSVKYGIAALLMKELLSFTVSGSNILGLIADFAACGTFISVFGLTARGKITARKMAFAACIGSLARSAAVIPVNLVILRLQFGTDAPAVIAQLPLIIVFNLLKCGLGSVCAIFLYPKLRRHYLAVSGILRVFIE
jgi:coenzyme F420-0:L-glutamate ligase/coenzyme F420-1:gamma-L-glutamate ligase